MNAIEKQIYDEEGERLEPYKDSAGWWTIGVGHLIDNRKGGRIPVVVSRLLLENDVQDKIHELSKRAPWTSELDEARFAAIVNMAFQLGVDGVLQFKNMIKCLRNND